MQRLSESVYVETEFPGANVGAVMTEEGVVLIDTPGRPTDAIQWKRQVESLGPFRYLINTEHHFDHTLGNFFFEAPVIAHEGTRANFLYRTLMQGATLENPAPLVAAIDPEGMALIEGYRPRLPQLTFSDRLTLYLGRQRLELYHLPGHVANGTAVYVLPDRILFTSDNLVHQCMPWIHESDPWKWQVSLERLAAFDAAALVPGHGPVCDRTPLQTLKDFLADVISTVEARKREGLTREEVEAQVTFIDRFPVEPEYRAIAPRVQRMNVARVYDLLP